VKSVVPTVIEGRVLFTTPNGLTEAPRGKGSSNAPIQIIISNFAADALPAVVGSGSKNMSYTTLALVEPSTGAIVQLACRFIAERFDNISGRISGSLN